MKLFVDVMSKKLLIVNKPAIAATCIYLACRIMQCPRVLEEIALGTGTDVSLIQRMQSDILKGLSMVIRITKSGDIFLRFAQRCLERLHLRQLEDLRTSTVPGYTHQVVLSLPYLCLEEGISLCERIAEYELLPENIAPQAVVGAVLVWLFLLIADVDVKPLLGSRTSSNTPPAEANNSPEDECTQSHNDDVVVDDGRPVLAIKPEPGVATESAAMVIADTRNGPRLSWPPITLDIIAEECFTTVTVLKNVILRLFASMKVLVLLPASGAESTALPSTSDNSKLETTTTTSSAVRHSPPVEIHQRFAQAFGRFQDALAVAAATAATSVSSPTSTTTTGKKRKRSLSIGGGMPTSAPSSSTTTAMGTMNGAELALTLDRLLTGDAERPYIRSPLWRVGIATEKPPDNAGNGNVDRTATEAATATAPASSSLSPPDMAQRPSATAVVKEEVASLHRTTPHSAPVSRVTSSHQLPRVASTNGLKLTPSLTPRSATPMSARDEEIQRLSRGLFTSGLKRFKAL